ncbi:sugar transferase [Crocinitomicaceae bacterium]|jgi:exopolysaccharide biosynthesis polyprenyl glycosylphosphotransferase|nr:sugar transferase [Crocinitomicaceae bacterium]MDB4606247.1 sugar transferase [Crocinitomicaceae bacterium]
MGKNSPWLTLFLVSDYISALFSWGVFFFLRKTLIENQAFELDINFWLGVGLIPLFWMLLYFLQGTYIEIRRMFRLKLLNLTLSISVLGSLIIFFSIILDDQVRSYEGYYWNLLILFAVHFLLTFTPRLIINTWLVHTIRKPNNGFKTIIIGGTEKAVDILEEVKKNNKNVNSFIGYINMNGNDRMLDGVIPYLGHFDDLEALSNEYEADEYIIAIESAEHDKLMQILLKIDDGIVRIKTLPDTYVILSGSVKMTNIYGALLLDVISDSMPFWQKVLKRLMDFAFSLVAVILLIPFYLFSAIAVKLSSPGPIFFLQERIGKDGRVFKIFKFRTMFIDSEKNGPQLSSENDPRITKIGSFMRKTRLDEFPQFLNVLLGHMSIVGPRPERKYYIDQIAEIEPQYNQLTKVRPGITSWGQVKYGYAENVDQMLQRMKFDLLYLKNRSISLDVKIMLHTLLIVIKAEGK